MGCRWLGYKVRQIDGNSTFAGCSWLACRVGEKHICSTLASCRVREIAVSSTLASSWLRGRGTVLGCSWLHELAGCRVGEVAMSSTLGANSWSGGRGMVGGCSWLRGRGGEVVFLRDHVRGPLHGATIFELDATAKSLPVATTLAAEVAIFWVSGCRRFPHGCHGDWGRPTVGPSVDLMDFALPLACVTLCCSNVQWRSIFGNGRL